MKHHLAILACICATTTSLKVLNRTEQAADVHTASAAVTARGGQSQSILHVTHKVNTSAHTKLVWMIGCSIDNRAMRGACSRAGASLNPAGVPEGDQNDFQYCTFDGVTLVFTFHPGASPPPYWEIYKDTLRTSQQRIQDAAQTIQRVFGKGPDAAVVDSSVWDLVTLWIHDGRPTPWPYERQEFLADKWCSSTIPTFLDFVQDLVPHTRIAFRTPLPGVADCYSIGPFLCNADRLVNDMNGCLKNSLTNTRLYGKYDLLDVNAVALQEAHGQPVASLYSDGVHPTHALYAVYMSTILKWVDRG